jgi:hypothetical protein
MTGYSAFFPLNLHIYSRFTLIWQEEIIGTVCTIFLCLVACHYP